MVRHPRIFPLYNGFRWHIRAYNQEHQTYRDFVLARFITSPELGEAALHAAEQDHDWQSVEALIIAPHPDLTPDQQAVIADDYGMEDGRTASDCATRVKTLLSSYAASR